MIITLCNGVISLEVETLGAQMMSLKKDGLEYLWQGDPKYWSDRAPALFPYIGRLAGGKYLLHGKEYSMGIHGFAAQSEFLPVEQGAGCACFVLNSSDATRAQYPFDFSLGICYALEGNTVNITCTVRNLSDETMPFAIGGHPGFRVPLQEGEKFEDYYIEFSESCVPDRIGFSADVLLSGRDEPYALQNGRVLALSHELFDEDAIILKNIAKRVSLRSCVSERSVTVDYPHMPYLGLWHMPRTDAPYLCIEPWSSLPSRHGVTEELLCKSDLLRLSPGESGESGFAISVT